MNRQTFALPCVVLAEALAISLWFCGTVALPDVTSLWNLSDAAKGGLLTAVQLGFILGTLVLALTSLADAFPASRVFAASCFFGCLVNLGFAYLSQGFWDGLLWRFATGIALAGIYPLGMKLVVTWLPNRAGEALGWLVGAVSLGTSIPFLLRAVGGTGYWQIIASVASLLTLLAGGMVLWLGDGPASRTKSGKRFDPRLAWSCFRNPTFRASAFGYFGHMWELYALWSSVPFLVQLISPDKSTQAWWAFIIIAMGAPGNVLGGWLSRGIGSARVAVLALATSGCICLLCPLLPSLPIGMVIVLLCLWGFTAPADSPQFSAISSKACPPEAVGSALSLQNSIGFMMTVISIQLSASLVETMQHWIGWLWCIGPVLGVWAMRAHVIGVAFTTKNGDNL